MSRAADVPERLFDRLRPENMTGRPFMRLWDKTVSLLEELLGLNLLAVTTDRLLGRDTAGSGAVEELTVSGGVEFTGSGGIRTSAFTGDVTKTAGGTALTIANDAVTYAKMQNVSATSRFLGRITAGAGDTEELTAANAKTILALAQADISGLTTADSPQFTGVNVGNASDTTITRASAGVIAVEGVNVVTTAGGITFAADVSVPAEAYGAGWDGSNEAPTKNDVYDKIQTISAGSAAWALAGTGQTATGVYDFAVDGAKANIDFVGLASFNELLVMGRGLSCGTSGVRQCLASVNNGSSFYSASGDYVIVDSVGAETNGTGFNHSTATTAARSLMIHIRNLKGVAKMAYIHNSVGLTTLFIASSSDLNAIRVNSSGGGNITAGTVRVYAR